MSLLSRRFLRQRQRPHVVIAGGNFAGLAAARALDPSAVRVTVIDASPNLEWRPNLHELLSRRKTPEQLVHDRRLAVERLGHDFVQDTLSAIDRGRQCVHLASGMRLDYDALVLALGNVSNTPAEAPVLTTKSVAEVQRLGHALTRLAALPGARDVVVVGGGIEGVEMLGEIVRRFGTERLNLHLLEAGPALFARYDGLHAHLAQALACVRLHLDSRVAAVDKDGLRLADGRWLPSRLTVWTAGSASHPLLAAAGLADAGSDAPVHASLQSTVDASVFVIGDAARLPTPLPKQSYHALDMGRHVAASLHRHFAGQPLPAFRPRPRPQLMSVGERDAVLLLPRQALTSPALLTLKEALYQYGYHRLMPPANRPELGKLLRELRQGVAEWDAWRTLARSADTRVFQAR